MGIRTIGGIAYRELTETTMEMDAAILREVRSLGADNFEKLESETAEDFVERILTSLIEGGQAFGLLGCFLIPEGKSWSRELVKETADIFRRTTDPADKALLRAALIPYLFSFFVIGLASAKTSQKYSATLRGIMGQPKTAEASTSVSGRKLHAPWPVGILVSLRMWLAGLFVKPSSHTSRS